VHVERTPRRFWPRSALAAIAGRGLGSVPPPMLVVAGIVSVQIGSALAKLLFPIAGALGVVTLRLVFAAAVLLVAWRPSLRMTRRAWLVVVAFGAVLGVMNAMFLRGHQPRPARCHGDYRVPRAAGAGAGRFAPLA